MSTILLGCDPEVFVKKNNNFFSAHGLIPGDKKNPFKVKNGAVQVDGMALEFNIDPAADENAFVFSIQSVFDQMCAMVPEYEVVATPVAHFTEQYMKEQPKEALELGCEPDYCGWTGDVNKRPDANRPMRTASGHIHIGWTEGQDIQNPSHQQRVNAVAQQMDFFLGLPSLFYDEDKERREMYGKAGALRYKSYGGEYRTLSNAWLKSEARMRFVYRNAIKGMQELMSGNFLPSKFGDIQTIINTSDKKKAMKIIKEAKLEMCDA
jgi:Phage phiEco32-like COOH.NH2 ligase-type 2